jgi:hypothetical protein
MIGRKWLLAFALLSPVVAAENVLAQGMPPEIIAVGSAATPINLPVIPPSDQSVQPAPAGSYEGAFDNVFDILHEKELTFEPLFTNKDPNKAANIRVWFDWIALGGVGRATSPPVAIVIAAGATADYKSAPGAGQLATPFVHRIEFCPKQVSLHVENNGPGGPVTFFGTFTHHCITDVPEPSGTALAVAAMAIVLPWRRRS